MNEYPNNQANNEENEKNNTSVNDTPENISNLPENETAEPIAEQSEAQNNEAPVEEPKDSAPAEEEPQMAAPQTAASEGYSYEMPRHTEQSSNPPKKEEPKKSFGMRAATGLVLCCILFSALFGVGGGMLTYRLMANNAPADSSQGNSVIFQSAPSSEGSQNVIYSEDSTVNVVQKAKPSVVEISTETVTTSSFFGQYITAGAGSGVILTSDGYIVTNNHVIENASTITVTTVDGKTYEATLIGTDADTDIAVIKIDPGTDTIAPATIGNSSDLIVGEPVVAIGNPLGSLGGTVTNGIISALDREITVEGQKMTLLQTNAAINPGNSGGGLFNSKGELIGIVNAKSSSSGIEGLGFAIPSDTAKDVIEQLVNYGYIRGRVMLGITYVDILSSNDYLQHRGTELGKYITDFGIYVYTSKQEALKLGDRIIAVNGTAVSQGTDIKQVIKDMSVGDVVEITIVREKEIKTVEITLLESTPENSAPETLPPAEIPSEGNQQIPNYGGGDSGSGLFPFDIFDFFF